MTRAEKDALVASISALLLNLVTAANKPTTAHALAQMIVEYMDTIDKKVDERKHSK